jgi:hypothetical protein
MLHQVSKVFIPTIFEAFQAKRGISMVKYADILHRHNEDMVKFGMPTEYNIPNILRRTQCC